MSRPRTVRSKTKSKTAHCEAKTPVERTAAAKPAAPESTPDQNAKTEHRAESHKEAPVEEKPWSEWLWSEEGQMLYRGRKDSKGEWEYDFAALPPQPKERPYTPPREEPIEYLIEELRVIWEPRLIEVPGANIVTVTPGSGNDTSKGAGEKVKVTAEEAKSAEGKGKMGSKGDEKESKVAAAEKQPEKLEKPKKEKHAVKRGRQLERPERRPPSHKERREKVEGWRNGLE